MSLLDDVSIVVTPNGYKAGELYAVIPVPVYGAEDVVNGDFSNGTTGWALNSNWSLGGVGVIADGTSDSTIWQSGVVEDNKQYIVTYTLTDFLQGSINVDLSGGNGITRTVAGTYTEVITSGTSPTTRLSFEGGLSFKVTLSNVSVKEWTGADMDVTRATAATRVDENGLVNYAEVIGGEEIVDGDFPSGTTAWSFGGGWSLGVDSAEATSGSSGKLSQTNTLNGKYAQVTLTVSNYGGAGLILIDYGSTGSAYITSDGTHTLYGTYDQDTFEIYKSATFSGNVTNISVKEILRDNVPRIDYTGGGCPHILAEPQRTNLIPYSEDFSNASWTKVGSSVTPNATTSPDGTINADKLVENTSTGGHQIQSITSASNSTIYTTSVFVKYAGREWIRFTDAQSSNRIHFNTLTGVFGTISGTVIDYNKTALENGWYKLSFTTTSVASAYTPRIALAEADNDVSYTGDGVSGVYIYGCSLEVGSYPTSYIPTSGSTVTRNQDIFTRDGIGSLINDSEGVLFLEIARLSSVDNTSIIWSISDGSNSNAVSLYYGSGSKVYVDIFNSTGTKSLQHSMSSTEQANFNKLAIKYKSNDIALWVNGNEVATNTDAISLSGLNELISSYGSGSFPFFGKVKQLQVYDTALTDNQLIQLTGEAGTHFFESYAEMASALTYTIQ
jgi:hypothetical protein